VFVGFSGGAAELFAEQAESTSITLEPHSPELRTRLATISTLNPDVIHNPFDLTVDGAVHYEEVVEALAASGEYDVIVSQGTPARSFEAADPLGAALARRQRYSAALMASAARHGILATFLDTSDHQPGIGVFSSPPPNDAYYALGNNGVRAISNAIDYGVRRTARLARSLPREAFRIDAERLPDLSSRSGSLSEAESKALIRAYGIPVTEDVLATSKAEAVAAAESIGFPVVLKVVAAGLAHKSDAGGVALDLDRAEDVGAAWDTMMASVTRHSPSSRVDGALVSRQARGGTEFIAGIQNDEHLGPVVVAGVGGIFVEILKDVVLIRPPFTPEEALAALGTLRSAALLKGTRGLPALDKAAFAEALVRLGQLALDQRETLLEMDINPIFVFPEGEGVLAVDALAVTSQASGANTQSPNDQE
jgi:acyl-CoA synthetase (NDP forming)